MKKILILVTTDHSDTDEATRSVMSAMERAGYNQLDYHVWSDYTCQQITTYCDALMSVCEPEVDPSAQKH